MTFQKTNIDLNIDASNVSQNFTFNTIISKINAFDENSSFGTKILAKELLKSIDENKSKEVFEILETLVGGAKISNENFIAFANPIPDKILFSSAAFQNTIDSNFKQYEGEVDGDKLNFRNILLYNLILERFYGIDHIHTEYIYETYINGFSKYFELRIDFTFVDITYDGELPKIDLTTIRQNKFDTDNIFVELVKDIDLSRFHFSGFSILRLLSRDKKFIIRKIQNIVNSLSTEDPDSLKKELRNIFYSIIEKDDVEFYFLPIFELTGFPISGSEYAENSILLGKYFNSVNNTTNSNIYTYLNKPSIWSYGIDPNLDAEDEEFINILNNHGVKSFLGIPLYHHDQFVGLIEISSTKYNFDKNDAFKIKKYLPHFAQLANDCVHYSKTQLNNIILENFTNIQPALQWRFNEVAVSYFTQLNHNKEQAKLEEIIFEDVYPIYGSVDIKDSTQIRSTAQKELVYSHFENLLSLFEDLALIFSHQELTICVEKIKKVIQCVDDVHFENHLYNLRDLLEGNTACTLRELMTIHSNNEYVVRKIKEILDIISIVQYTNNYPFEKSLKAVTQVIKQEYDLLNNELQSIFPCYFETFRTDGIEYDAYIGQSITPTLTFSDGMILDMFKQQIISMIKIIGKVRQLANNIPIPLQTTQLLFVHPDRINISFRQDEKRFDVEGGYNIRYQIIKKRIDKVLIENTQERLVQPDSIAIVFSNENVKDKITGVLQELIKWGMLEDKIEIHSLEELQGISSLRAFRVNVI